MREHRIKSLEAHDLRFPLDKGTGSDAVHSGAEYAFATTLLRSDDQLLGTGIALTLGAGNELVCDAIELLGKELIGREIEELMAEFGEISRQISQHPQLRWLGPHKGVVHLALASLTNACFDLWAKSRDLPLWRLLLDLTPRQLVGLLDLSYLEDVLTCEQAEKIIVEHSPSRHEREPILRSGYPGYDTSVGWFQYEDEHLRELAKDALGKGFRAFKLKVGSQDGERDVRRAFMLREVTGPDALIMLDANQQWTLPQALRMCESLRAMCPHFVEEPTHPDDVFTHRTLAEAVRPSLIAVQIVQVDCTRVAGISEFLTVSLLARKFNLKVVPHVGDMGQIHQHLVLFNHIAMGHEALFLEYIPHLRERFANAAVVERGVYITPQATGCSTGLISLS